MDLLIFKICFICLFFFLKQFYVSGETLTVTVKQPNPIQVKTLAAVHFEFSNFSESQEHVLLW